MSEYVSNTPISRPVNTGYRKDWDLGGGLCWNHEHGMFYDNVSEPLMEFRLPAPRVKD